MGRLERIAANLGNPELPLLLVQQERIRIDFNNQIVKIIKLLIDYEEFNNIPKIFKYFEDLFGNLEQLMLQQLEQAYDLSNVRVF